MKIASVLLKICCVLLLYVCPVVAAKVPILDIDVDDNQAADIAFGGTNAKTAAEARANLGLAIGVDVAAQAHNHSGVYQPASAGIPTVAASQAEMEAGVETALRSMSPHGVAQAITALAVSGGMIYPGSGVPSSTGSAWGPSYTLDTDLSSVSASDDTIPSAKAAKSYADTKLSPSGSAASLTNFPTLNQNTTGTAAGLSAQYIDWTASTGPTSIANKPTLTTLTGANSETITNAVNGQWKFAGAGGTNNEDLILDLETTANKVAVSSSTGVTDISFSALNLVTTGNIMGGLNRVGSFASPTTSTGTYSLAAANCWGSVLFYNDTDTIALPAAVAGMSICIYVTGTSLTTIDPNGTDVVVRDGTAQSGGVTMTLSGAAGNYVCLFADAANHWVTLGYKGTLAQGS